MVIRQAAKTDVPAMVRIFLAGFRDELLPTFGEPFTGNSMRDVFFFCLKAEPAGFFVAEEDGVILGYNFVSRSISRLQVAAVLRGWIFRWAWFFFSGSYGITWGALWKMLKNKASFVGSSQKYRSAGDAQVLNIAVAAEARGRGVAGKLMEAGIDYLRKIEVRELRLEVRRDNFPAVRVYERAGFVEKGSTRDLKGEWVVMVKTIET